VTQDLLGVTLTLTYRVDLPKGATSCPSTAGATRATASFTEGNDFREDNPAAELGGKMSLHPADCFW